MRLYFVRHGKTQWNLEGRLQGSRRLPFLKNLLSKSVSLAITSVILISTWSYQVTYHALKTTELIMESQKLKLKLPIPRICVSGNWETRGTKLSIIQAIYSKEMDAFRHNLANFRANNFQAESVYHTTKRVADLVRTLKDGSMKNVLLVGHGANLTASIRSLLGFEPGLLRKAGGLDNASVTILETDDCEHFTLKSWNDTSYRTQVNKIS